MHGDRPVGGTSYFQYVLFKLTLIVHTNIGIYSAHNLPNGKSLSFFFLFKNFTTTSNISHIEGPAQCPHVADFVAIRQGLRLEACHGLCLCRPSMATRDRETSSCHWKSTSGVFVITSMYTVARKPVNNTFCNREDMPTLKSPPLRTRNP